MISEIIFLSVLKVSIKIRGYIDLESDFDLLSRQQMVIFLAERKTD